MKFININPTEMTNIAAVKAEVLDILDMYYSYDSALDRSYVFNRVVEGLNAELKELGKTVTLEVSSSELLVDPMGPGPSFDIDFNGTDYGDIHIVVDYDYYGKPEDSELIVRIDGNKKEVNNFDWKVGYSILQVVAGYLVGCPMVGVYTKL